jgi:hypothetical protein
VFFDESRVSGSSLSGGVAGVEELGGDSAQNTRKRGSVAARGIKRVFKGL